MKKYRFLSLLLTGLMALTLIAPALALEDPQPQAKAAIVVDGDNREVLYEFNAYQRMYPASITKIMTSMVVLDAVAAGELSLDTQVTASAQAVDLPWNSSTAGILAGETLSILDLLYCDLLPSGNEACNILSEAVAGTSAEFVARMNAKAQELGMKDTHFMNPHGLHDPEHYTTAYDVYLMASAAMENETFRTIVRSPSHTLPATNLQPERTIYSSNGLLSSFYAIGYTYGKAIGIKTGNTGEAGRCLASAAVDELGRTFYCVVLGTEDTKNEDGSWYKWSFPESKRLLEWAFDNFQRTTLLSQDTENVLREVSVTLSDEADYVKVQPVGSIEATVPSDFDISQAELENTETRITVWAARSKTDRSGSDCRSGCTGMCYSSCTGGCTGCGSGCPTGCSGCGSGCPTGCSGCGSGCPNSCSGCGSGCPTGCSGSCSGAS